jgi:hypothetical protein
MQNMGSVICALLVRRAGDVRAIAFGALGVLAPLVAGAQSGPPAPITDVNQFGVVACNVAGFVFNLAMAVSIITILYAAFLYLTASGDANRISQAHKTLTYAGVGIAVALMASGVPVLIANMLNTDSGSYWEAATCQ